jgi:ligand-binding SRPBCC domain-containing protein
MLQGMFRSFEHDHYFEPLTATDTVMRDDLRFAAPLGPLGRLAEAAVLRRYLERLLIARNQLIRGVAEAPEEVWRPFLPDR